MEEKYRIGKHEFETREEWENALSDLNKIRYIVERTNIAKADEALKLYQLIRDGEIIFKSEIGEAFFRDISDSVALNTEKLLKSKQKKQGRTHQEDGGKEKRGTKKALALTLTGTACILTAVCCFGFYIHSQYREAKAIQKLEQTQEQKSISQAIHWYFEQVSETEETGEVQAEEAAAQNEEGRQEQALPEAAKAQPQVLPEYATLHLEHPDLAGWLNVPGTAIDYPVMQTPDNEYYLTRGMNGEEDINGALFLDYRNDIMNQNTNLIIYGHNMRSGAMFGGLKAYLEESYFNQHKTIYFDTLYEKQTYEVIAVCLSQVGYRDDGNYHYYDFINAQTPEEYQAFVDNIHECAVYDSTAGLTTADKLLTLSTCNSYTDDGRLFVVAKKVQ